MGLQYLGIDPETDDGRCPTVYYDDTRDDFIVQGWRVTDPKVLPQLTMDDRETVVRIPHRMLGFFSAARRDGLG